MTEAQQKPITMAMEDYLEAIYEIGLEKKVVRVRGYCCQNGCQNAHCHQHAQKPEQSGTGGLRKI